MVSPRTFPFVRPRKNSTKQKNKKGTRLLPPLQPESSFFHAPVQEDIRLMVPFPRGIRGSTYESLEDKENKGNKDDNSQIVPLKMVLPMAEGLVEVAKPVESTGISQPHHQHQRTESSITITQRTFPEASTQTRPVNPQESLHTIIFLDTPVSSDDEESDISPLSDDRPSSASRSGAALRRCFPEPSSNNFAIVSPMSADAEAGQQNIGRIGFPSILETELHDRVHTSYKNSVDIVESPMTDIEQALEQKTGSSSGSGSEDVFDCASSCYSRRSSITSVGTECLSPATKELNRYSILSPVAAGVFDDTASACPSRTASFASRGPSGTANPGYAASSIYPNSTPPSRRSSLSPNDIRNKPLPLEPVEEPSPLVIRRHDLPPSLMAGASQSTRFLQTYRRDDMEAHSTSSLHRRKSDQACDTCGGCGGDNSSQSRRSRRPEWSEAGNGHRLRHIPTLAQAAEELEFALADLARDPYMQQRTLLVLDGPLQISRHNGDLVATRPAPMPPSTKPHSKTHPPKSFKKHKSIHTKVKSVEDAIHPWSGTHRSFSSIKEKASPPLPRKDSQNKDETPAPKTPKLKDEAKWPSKDSSSNSNSTDEIPPSPKMKKSFKLTMPSFRRTRDPRATTLQEPRLSVVLSSRSESSLLPDPQVPETRSDGSGSLRLSSHSDSSLDLDVDRDHAAGTASKRDDLRLQLPRLQTQDLPFGNSFEPLSIKKGLVTQIQIKQQEPAQQQHPQNQMKGVGTPSFCAADPTHQVQHHHRHPHPAQAAASGDARRSTLPLQLRIIPPEDEKMLVASEIVASERLRHSQAFVSTAQASSVQLPPEQIFELAATPPSPTSTMPAMFMGSPHMPVDFPVDMPEPLIISMMERIDSLDDLFNFVLVNKRFYQIFKRRELHFIKGALFHMSPPAWELREMSPPWKNEWQQLLDPDTPLPEYTPELYLNRYACDIYTLAQLKSMILVRCSPFLRRDTVKGLSGVDTVRAEEVDDAFWRIWTFCRIFGSGKGRENDLEGQMDWMKGGSKARSSFGASSTMTEPFGINNVLFEPPEGFARGNSATGLSAKQLYDMTEIWTCLGVLLQPLHGKCVEARNAGIFQGLDIPEVDTAREETALGQW